MEYMYIGLVMGKLSIILYIIHNRGSFKGFLGFPKTSSILNFFNKFS